MANIGQPLKQWDVVPSDVPNLVPESVPQKQETPEPVPV